MALPFQNQLGVFFLPLIVAACTIVLAHSLSFLLSRFLKKRSAYVRMHYTQIVFFKHLVVALIYLIGVGVAIFTIPSLRAISLSMFAGAGVLAIIIGFASQQALSNVIAGVFIAVFKPFRVGDWINVQGRDGIIEDITLRHTVIKDFQMQRVVIPNSVINNEVITNMDLTDEKIRKFVEFGISYDSDVDKAMKVIQEEARKHPSFIDNRTAYEKHQGIEDVPVRLIGFGDSSINLRAYVWANDPLSAFNMACDLRKNIKQRFDKEGIEIPFPYRTIVYKDKQRRV